MTLHDKIIDYCKHNVSEFDREPLYYSFSEQIDYNTGEVIGVELKPKWKSIELDPYGIAKMTDNEPKKESIIRSETLRPTENTEIYNELSYTLKSLRSLLKINEGEIKKVSFIQNYEFDYDYDKFELYTINDSNYRAFCTIKSFRTTYTNTTEKIKQFVYDQLKSYDEDITKKDIVYTECSFEDIAICDLLSIRGNLMTPNPHNYYSDVESVEEYIDVLSDTPEEKEKLQSKDKYQVFYRLDDYKDTENKKEPMPSAKKLLESLMTKEMNSIAKPISKEYKYEAEAITIRDYSEYPDYEPDYYTNDLQKDGEEIMFFIHMPFDNI